MLRPANILQDSPLKEDQYQNFGTQEQLSTGPFRKIFSDLAPISKRPDKSHLKCDDSSFLSNSLNYSLRLYYEIIKIYKYRNNLNSKEHCIRSAQKKNKFVNREPTLRPPYSIATLTVVGSSSRLSRKQLLNLYQKHFFSQQIPESFHPTDTSGVVVLVLGSEP